MGSHALPSDPLLIYCIRKRDFLLSKLSVNQAMDFYMLWLHRTQQGIEVFTLLVSRFHKNWCYYCCSDSFYR